MKVCNLNCSGQNTVLRIKNTDTTSLTNSSKVFKYFVNEFTVYISIKYLTLLFTYIKKSNNWSLVPVKMFLSLFFTMLRKTNMFRNQINAYNRIHILETYVRVINSEHKSLLGFRYFRVLVHNWIIFKYFDDR